MKTIRLMVNNYENRYNVVNALVESGYWCTCIHTVTTVPVEHHILVKIKDDDILASEED